MSYAPHKKYKRIGECNHCGVCCVGCKFQQWIAMRDIKVGEKIDSPKDFISVCLIHDHPEHLEYQTEYVAKGCIDFPHHPLSTPAKCGYRWIEQ